MKAVVMILCAAAAYLLGGVNPAIIISQKIYHSDVREHGSHNAGFTNFKRIFGNKRAYTVFALDVLKGSLMAFLSGCVFRRLGYDFRTGAAFACLFTILGHSWPVWYGFRGGKGVAVFAGAIWFIDWRIGLAALTLFLILLFSTRYMSLSVMCTYVFCVAAVAVLRLPVWAVALVAASVIFVIARHWENIRRLRAGTESKFRFHDQTRGGMNGGQQNG